MTYKKTADHFRQ